MRAVPNSTVDTSAAAVRSSTASAIRSASVSTGSVVTRTTSTPASASRSSWRRRLWNSPSEATSRGRAPVRSRPDRSRTSSSWVLSARATSAPGSANHVRTASRTRSARSKARPHLSSTASAASSKAATRPSRATSGQAWCECPVSRMRSVTRNRP